MQFSRTALGFESSLSKLYRNAFITETLHLTQLVYTDLFTPPTKLTQIALKQYSVLQCSSVVKAVIFRAGEVVCSKISITPILVVSLSKTITLISCLKPFSFLA